ncbi:precorrin-2 dehydrogenase [Lentibacillus populi]|uniref:precorrin-2 dehydrogenase n=1 Tax=Lentibacillus populi TaxID=1827502 RepID=A0A9W5X7H5_9BACI|nr:NAD(P)-binding protein [Lentibacillus populi]GGB60457.1 precorrin-2 dehydrogenase [Lentibacillus populi]
MALTPFMIDLVNKRVVIVGGGLVAERRMRCLLESGACVTVISPEIGEGIRALWEEGYVNWKQRHFEADDVADAFLIIVATNDPATNQTVIEAVPETSLVNVAADAEQGNIQFPAHLQQGKLSISIATNGASPMLAAKIRNRLATTYDRNYGDYVDFLYESRQLIKRSLLTKQTQTLLLRELLDESFKNKQKQMAIINWLESLVKGEEHDERLGR